MAVHDRFFETNSYLETNGLACVKPQTPDQHGEDINEQVNQTDARCPSYKNPEKPGFAAQRYSWLLHDSFCSPMTGGKYRDVAVKTAEALIKINSAGEKPVESRRNP